MFDSLFRQVYIHDQRSALPFVYCLRIEIVLQVQAACHFIVQMAVLQILFANFIFYILSSHILNNAPYQHIHSQTMSQYRGDSVQEFRFALRPYSICIFLFLKNKESPDDLVCHIKTGNQRKTDNFLILFVLPYQNCIDQKS